MLHGANLEKDLAQSPVRAVAADERHEHDGQELVEEKRKHPSLVKADAVAVIKDILDGAFVGDAEAKGDKERDGDGGDAELEKLMAEGEAQAESAMEKGRAPGEAGSAMGGEARGQSTGTAGFKTVPRSQISGREAGSKSRGDFCKPIYDQV